MTFIRKEKTNITNYSNETIYNIDQNEVTGYSILLLIVIITLCYLLHYMKKKCKK